MTLENAIYLTMKNDVAVLFHDSIDLFEQQSTINENMALRGFFYAAREYEEWLIANELDQRIYSKRRIMIPAPKYFVMCNADEKMPEMWDEKLSDAFMKPSPGYEWTAHVININAGHNKKIMNRCETLEGYAILIKMIRDNRAAGMTLDEAVTRAVNECIEKGILKKYLAMNKTEVFDMILYEFDQKAHDKIMYEDGKADGRVEGRVEGREEGILSSLKSLMKTMNLTPKQAMQALNLTVEQQRQFAPLL